jgi:allophanate hydrolase
MRSPIEAAEAAIAADHAYADPALWITRLPDAAIRARARLLEAEGPRGRPLWGTTFAVKDNLDIADLPTTVACPGYAYVPERTAVAVRRVLDAGALLLGKTNLDQFATGLVGVRSPYGVPRNPFDATRVPGGSSSGSAVAVAAGIAEFALATDTAGSGRVPAMFCNIVGLKPTIGSISASGLVPACQSLDTISVFAGTVDDALAVLRVAVGYDAADPYSRAAPFAHLRRGAHPPGARIAGVNAAALCDAPVAAAYQRAAALFAAEPVDIAPLLEIARLLYDGPWVAERTAAFRDLIERRPEMLHPVTRVILENGLTRRSVDGFDAFHALAAARRHAETLFAKYSALLLPTAPFTPTLAALAADGFGPNSRLGTYVSFVNLCDLAAIAVPAGLGTDGLPVGVMLVGPAWSEGRLAGLADALHRAMTDTLGATGRALPPPSAPDPLASEETALFCVGEHMSGLSLNGGLTGLGGRLLRVAATAPHYRLYALGSRAGIVRAASGNAILGEVWAMPTSAIGALLATVPPPLCLGTVELDDGPCLGFLAEAAGVVGMRDITTHGGWRAYRAATVGV